MGGQKRKSISAMEKAQRLREEKERATKRRAKAVIEKKVLSIGLPSFDDKELLNQLVKMKAITPSSIASTYGVRVSVAKDFLEELEKRGIVSLVESCKRIKIYKPTISAA